MEKKHRLRVYIAFLCRDNVENLDVGPLILSIAELFFSPLSVWRRGEKNYP